MNDIKYASTEALGDEKRRHQLRDRTSNGPRRKRTMRWPEKSGEREDAPNPARGGGPSLTSGNKVRQKDPQAPKETEMPTAGGTRLAEMDRRANTNIRSKGPNKARQVRRKEGPNNKELYSVLKLYAVKLRKRDELHPRYLLNCISSCRDKRSRA